MNGKSAIFTPLYLVKGRPESKSEDFSFLPKVLTRYRGVKIALVPFTGTLIGILSRERESRNSRESPGLSSLSLSHGLKTQKGATRKPLRSTQTLPERIERISGLLRDPL